MLTTAMVYGDVIEAAFDLHRWKLYEALRWPTPTTPADERATGAKLTQYIWRGSDDDTPVFDVATPTRLKRGSDHDGSPALTARASNRETGWPPTKVSATRSSTKPARGPVSSLATSDYVAIAGRFAAGPVSK